jgi:hypothetical protein
VAKKVGQVPTSPNPGEAVCFINQDIQWNFRWLALMDRLDLTNLQPTNVSASIARDVHSCDIVTEAIAWASAPFATLRGLRA